MGPHSHTYCIQCTLQGVPETMVAMSMVALVQLLLDIAYLCDPRYPLQIKLPNISLFPQLYRGDRALHYV